MTIVVVGLNHKTAPVEVRERLAFNTDQAKEALELFAERFPEAEAALLSTCNRVELYTVCDQEGWTDGQAIAAFLAEVRALPLERFWGHLYVHVGADAVEHILKVTCSLDSLVLGESQIVSQVKDAYKLACSVPSTGKIMNRLFHTAFATCKDVHASTAIHRGRVSVAGVAIELAQQLFSDMGQARALVIGAGEMGELLVKHLVHVGCKNITVVNRTFCRAKSMASTHGANALPWEQLNEQLALADIVVGSAAVETCLFGKADFKPIVQGRHKKTLLMIDIAVPRNFDPSINELENVYLFSVDDLSDVALQNQKAREHDIEVGLGVIKENAQEFLEWFDVRDLGPQIGQLKAAFTRISQRELDRFYVGKRENATCRNTLDPMVKRVANKILYCVIKHVNGIAKREGPEEASRVVSEFVNQAGQLTADNNHKEQSQ
jgi:glutamyl-tRNA reductase